MVLPVVALLVFVAAGALAEPPVVASPAAQYTVPSFETSGTYTNQANAYSTLPNPGTVNQTLRVQSPYYQQYQHQESPKLLASALVTPTVQATYYNGPPPPAQASVQLLQSENIFKAQAPAALGSGGAERSFFYSPKESVVYQVTKIPVSQVPGLVNALPVAQVPYEAPINGMMPPVETSYGVPAQVYGAPAVDTSYGVPAASPVASVYGAPVSAAPVVSYGSPVVTTTTTTYKLPSTHTYGAPIKVGGQKKKNKYFFKFGGLKLRYERPTVYVPNYYPKQTSTSYGLPSSQYGAPVVASKPIRS